MKIARRAGHRRMAWKNGQGLTEEVAAFPEGSGTDSFDWRLSIAHIGADGPFSVFAGIDRTIALLDGPGLALDLPGGRLTELTLDGAPFSFPGDWHISSRNLGGPTIDFNVMTRRGRCTHKVGQLKLAPGEALAAPDSVWWMFNSPARLETAGKIFDIERFEAIALKSGEKLTNRGDKRVSFLVVQICPAPERMGKPEGNMR